MFTIVAATVFSAAFLLSAGVIVWMFLLYHDKIVAALLFEPIPQNPAVYHIRVRQPRVTRSLVRPAVALASGVLAA